MDSSSLTFPERVRTYIEKNERRLTSAAFILGFLWDTLTLTRVDSLYENIVLTAYLAIAIFSIIVYHASETGRFLESATERIVRWLPIIMSFAFGGLFSGYLIFYSQSGTLAGSWPFLLFLGAIFIGNEFFRARYQQLSFQLAILFVALFSYCIFSVPVLINKIGPLVFLLSGLVSVAALAAIIYILLRVNRERLLRARHIIAGSILGLYLAFNVAYFANIIPPIPLALRELGVYHEVVKAASGKYQLTYEPPPWYAFGEKTDKTYHQFESEPVYAFSSVFAPAALNTTILHRWSSYNPTTKQWEVTTEVAFPITGGRDEGYRGYSLKRNVTPGKWRVDVITERGQLIGRKTFSVVTADLRPFKLTVVR